MRKIDKIIIHSSATLPTMDIGVAEIDSWHRSRGFKCVGYHFVIRRDGTLEYGRNLGDIGAHARGHNRTSIGICWVGGVDNDSKGRDNRTDWQKEMLVKLILSLRTVFGKLEIIGHRDVGNTECPSFDAKKEFELMDGNDFRGSGR